MAARARPRTSWTVWLIPFGLILLSSIPILSGALRLTQLSGGPELIPESERFTGFPVPVIAHIVAGFVFSVVGAFQFVQQLQRGRRSWHRVAGRVLIPAGFVLALSALWMATLTQLPAGDGPALLVIRWVFGSYLVAALVLAVRALLRRSYAVHGAWMTRAYALGVAAGTQAFALIPGSIVFGSSDETSRAVAMTVGWLINLAVAELVIWRRRRRAPGQGLRPPSAHPSVEPIRRLAWSAWFRLAQRPAGAERLNQRRGRAEPLNRRRRWEGARRGSTSGVRR